MGQRHQIYLRLPAYFYNEGNVNNKPERTIGLHHQWLFGRTALLLLNQFLLYAEMATANDRGFGCEDRPPFWQNNNAAATLAAAYSFHAGTGYSHGVCSDMEQESLNPLKGDNNNGITVIDLCGEKPRYCFMSLHHLECLDTDKEPKPFEPINAFQWLTLHYSQWEKSKARGRNGFETVPGLADQCNALLVDLHARGAEVLTRERVMEIFPAMAAEIEPEPIPANLIQLAPKSPFKVKSAPKRKGSRLQPWQVKGGEK